MTKNRILLPLFLFLTSILTSCLSYDINSYREINKRWEADRKARSMIQLKSYCSNPDDLQPGSYYLTYTPVLFKEGKEERVARHANLAFSTEPTFNNVGLTRTMEFGQADYEIRYSYDSFYSEFESSYIHSMMISIKVKEEGSSFYNKEVWIGTIRKEFCGTGDITNYYTQLLNYAFEGFPFPQDTYADYMRENGFDS